MKLADEEQEILDSVERGEWKPDPRLSAEKKQLQAAARATLRTENKRG